MSRYFPDDNGLSEDSLRGSTQHIALHLIEAPTEGSQVQYGQGTGRPLTRDPLSEHELSALRSVGVLVDEKGAPVESTPSDGGGYPTTVAPVVAASQLAPSQTMTREQFLARYSQDERLTPEQWRDRLASESLRAGSPHPSTVLPKDAPDPLAPNDTPAEYTSDTPAPVPPFGSDKHD